jgi:hypothetical protein
MNEHCEIMIEDLRKESKNNKMIHLAHYFGLCTLDIISGKKNF